MLLQISLACKLQIQLDLVTTVPQVALEYGALGSIS